MRVDIPSFRGMAPRMTPRGLPPNAAQRAINARLVSGDLEAWKQFLTIETLSQEPLTIYLLNDAWLSWLTDVDVARGLIPGDDTFRIYLTGPDEYAQPRWTNYALATSSPGGPAPVTTRPLGVPNPDTIPTLAIQPDTTGTSLTVDTLDEGGQLETWVVSPTALPHLGLSRVFEKSSSASPESYVLQCDRGDVGETYPAYMYKDFGIASAAAMSYSTNFQMHGAVDSERRFMSVHVANDIDGNGITVWYDNSTAPSQLNVGVSAGGWSRDSLNAYATSNVGVLEDDSTNKWYRVQVDVVATTDDEQTVTAQLYDGFSGTTPIGDPAVAVNRFALGGYCGQVFHVYDDSDAETSQSEHTTIHVTASGTRNIVTIDVPTNYLFTYVNDVGEESGIYLPSETITRPDGVSVVVTTSTSLPNYLTDEYFIVSKRIYRSVEGNTGPAFLFVAEIPLSQADYIDVLSDSELGDVLETELWVLPPANMRGILALPNGIMAGFFANQLCLSARNNPHAWPVEYRLTTDTDIVGIKNIDNIVVIATESFPYLAGGKDPAAFSMRKLDQIPQACVSKRSMAVLSEFGVVFASPDGLIAVSANGQDRNLTETIFTRTQWQALVPETILGIVHDDVYHFWYGEEPPDPLAAQVIFLAHWDSDTENIALGELSVAGSGVALSATESVFGGSSLFTSTGISFVSTNYLRYPVNARYLDLNGSFTIEGFVHPRFSTGVPQQFLMNFWRDFAGETASLYINVTTGTLSLAVHGGTVTTVRALTASDWNYFAFSQDLLGNMRVYLAVGGETTAVLEVAVPLPATGAIISGTGLGFMNQISGGVGITPNAVDTYLDDVRVTASLSVDCQRYTTPTIAVPTQPFHL